MKQYAFFIGVLLTTLGSVQAQVTDDPLHGCIIGTTCTEAVVGGQKVTPTTSNPLPNFTFTVSPANQTGDLLVDILVANNVANATSLSFSISGSNGGATDTSPIPSTAATLISGTWASGDLATFLGLSPASPTNPIGAWRPATQVYDPGATGYDVYQVDLGTNLLHGPSSPTAPVLTLAGSSLPIGSILTGFLNTGTTASPNYIATANSGGILEEDGPSPVPEPSSVALTAGLVLFALVAVKRRRSGFAA